MAQENKVFPFPTADVVKTMLFSSAFVYLYWCTKMRSNQENSEFLVSWKNYSEGRDADSPPPSVVLVLFFSLARGIVRVAGERAVPELVCIVSSAVGAVAVCAVFGLVHNAVGVPLLALVVSQLFLAGGLSQLFVGARSDGVIFSAALCVFQAYFSGRRRYADVFLVFVCSRDIVCVVFVLAAADLLRAAVCPATPVRAAVFGLVHVVSVAVLPVVCVLSAHLVHQLLVTDRTGTDYTLEYGHQDEAGTARYVVDGSVVEIYNRRHRVYVAGTTRKHDLGSKQTVVAGVPTRSARTRWTVVKDLPEHAEYRDLFVRPGDRIRLVNAENNMYLHSHDIAIDGLPESPYAEVTCYGRHSTTSDENDYWKIAGTDALTVSRSRVPLQLVHWNTHFVLGSVGTPSHVLDEKTVFSSAKVTKKNLQHTIVHNEIPPHVEARLRAAHDRSADPVPALSEALRRDSVYERLSIIQKVHIKLANTHSVSTPTVHWHAFFVFAARLAPAVVAVQAVCAVVSMRCRGVFPLGRREIYTAGAGLALANAQLLDSAQRVPAALGMLLLAVHVFEAAWRLAAALPAAMHGICVCTATGATHAKAQMLALPQKIQQMRYLHSGGRSLGAKVLR